MNQLVLEIVGVVCLAVFAALAVWLSRMMGPKLTVWGLNPKTKEPVILRVPYPINGKVELKKAKLSVLLDGAMMFGGGKVALVDLEKGIQIDYKGLDSWLGIDGKKTWVHERDLSFQQVANANNRDLLKWAKYALLLVAINLGALIAGFAYVTQKMGK